MINLPNQADIQARQPLTELRLYSGVPWDDNYSHVRLYSSESSLLSSLEKWRVFSGNASLARMAPIRLGEMTVKIPYTEMQVEGCNYLAFRNTGLPGSAGTTWQFCFITRVEWLSEKSTKIYFKRDIFQCSWYGITVKPCFVERHHFTRASDSLYFNLLPESFDSGDPICSNHQEVRYPPNNICVYTAQGTTGEAFGGRIDNNIYRMGSIGTYALSEVDSVNSLLDGYVESDRTGIEAVIGLFMAPSLCVKALGSDGEAGKNKQTINANMLRNLFFEGYIPKNKKLYSYPYCYLLVDNNEGKSATYRWENSYINDAIQFEVTGSMCTLPQILVTPVHYKDSQPGTARPLYSEALTINGFPQCAYQSDTFRAWQAQNKSTIALNSISAAGNLGASGVNLAASIAGGGNITQTAGDFIGSIQNVARLMATYADKERVPNTIHGKALSENINAAMGLTGFDFYSMSCRREFAEMIDSFWETYGYPVRKITRPNLDTRSSWNYVKTVDCGFTGKAELDDLKELRNMFNRGITLWHTDDIGNYNLSNN